MQQFSRKGRQLSLWLLSALTETAVAIPWMLLCYSVSAIPRWPEALPGAWLLVATYLAACFWEAGSRNRSEQAAARGRIISVVVGVAVVYVVAYFSAPAAIRTGSLLSGNIGMGIVPVAAYLWYQGAVRGTEGLEYSGVFTRFTRQAILAVVGVLLLVVTGQAGDRRVGLLLYWSVFLLFAAGLMLLVATRERALRVSQAEAGDPGANARTTGSTNLVVLGLAALTLLSSAVMSVEGLAGAAGRLVGAIGRVYGWVMDVLFLILYRWAIMLSPVLEWFIRLLRRNWQQPQQQQADDASKKIRDEILNRAGRDSNAATLLLVLKIALVVIVAAVLFRALYKLSHRKARKADPEEEEKLSLGFWASLWADLRGLLHRRPPAPAVAAGPAGPAPEQFDPRDPRSLFRRLQAWGAALGRARTAAETPSAYARALGDLRPEQAEAVATVTSLYNDTKYGDRSPDKSRVDRAAAAVERMD